MTDTNDAPLPAEAEDQPQPLTPKQLHRKAIMRLGNLNARLIGETRTFDAVMAKADLEVLKSDMSALVGVLTAKNIINADEFYQAAAEVAVARGNKLFAELNQPKIEVASALPEGQVNGHG